VFLNNHLQRYSELRIKNKVIQYQRSASYPPVTQKWPLKIPVHRVVNGITSENMKSETYIGSLSVTGLEVINIFLVLQKV
jgi:hypothetical protein